MAAPLAAQAPHLIVINVLWAELAGGVGVPLPSGPGDDNAATAADGSRLALMLEAVPPVERGVCPLAATANS